MKVLIAITKSNFGGAQRYVFDVAKGAQAAGHDTAVICGGEGILVEKLKTEGIRIISLPSLGRDVSIKNDTKVFFELINLFRQEKPDAIHLNSSKMGGLGAMAGLIAGVPRIIFTAHGFAFNEDRPWYQKALIKLAVWYTIFLSTKTICVSEKMSRDVKNFPLIQNRLVVIHNGIEPFALPPQTESSTLLVSILSEFHTVKGHDIALKAFAQVFKGKDAKLVLAGSGDTKTEMEQLARTLGISNQVDFLGFVPNAHELLSSFDIFLLPSRSEGLPYVLLEAGIASLPVIASRVGGIPEVITNEESGLLFEKENVGELVKAFEKLSNNPELRLKLGQNLHAYVLKHFGQKEMLDKTFALYK